MDSTLGVLFGAGAGAIAGYLSARLGKWQDDAKRRRAVATTLLIELRALDRQLRLLEMETDPADVLIEPLVGMLDTFRVDLLLFDANAIASSFLLRGHVQDIELHLRAARLETDQRPAAVKNFQVRGKARVALQEIVEVQKALLRNGAVLPPERERLKIYKRPNLPELPPSPFGSDEEWPPAGDQAAQARPRDS